MGGPGDTRIAAMGTLRGEITLSVADLAAAHATSERAIRRSLGNALVHTSSRSCEELALEVAQTTLARGAVPASSLSALGLVGTYPLRLQHDLGAEHAFTINSARDCTALVGLMDTADRLFRTDPALETVLLTAAEKYVTTPQRTVGRIDENVTRDIFSDGASALVLCRGAGPLALLGFGAATNGLYWDYWQRAREGNAPNDMHVMSAALPLFREAFARCLRAAKLDRNQIDLLVFPSEGPSLPYTFARTLDLPKHKVFVADQAPSHVGASDAVFSLEELLRSEVARTGAVVLVCSRTIGVVRFMLVRL